MLKKVKQLLSLKQIPMDYLTAKSRLELVAIANAVGTILGLMVAIGITGLVLDNPGSGIIIWVAGMLGIVSLLMGLMIRLRVPKEHRETWRVRVQQQRADAYYQRELERTRGY